MPRLGPIKRTGLIRHLRHCGFIGPKPGGNHEYMIKGDISVRIPNPHRGDISKGFLARILRQAGIKRGDWERL
jgi:predicted RNA binding protein YcfA (HicA-like mRNA interferase family)